jgi:hypothetical protein
MRVEALAFKLWRDNIRHMIQTAAFESRRGSTILHEIREKLAHFENEYPKLKQATKILKIALWNMKMNDNNLEKNTTRSQKKMRSDESDIRQQCRVKCGADVIIRHVLLFLISN